MELCDPVENQDKPYVKNIGKNVDVFIDSVIPENLKFLNGIDVINDRQYKIYDFFKKNTFF